MITDNKPIIKTTYVLSNIKTNNLQFRYKNPQASTNVKSYGIAFDNDNELPSSWGEYHWEVEKCMFYNCSTGIGVYNESDKLNSGDLAVWGSKFQDLRFENTSKSAINLLSTTAIGVPNNEIRNIKVLNQNYANSYYAIACRTEVLMENIDIEDWINSAVYIDSCVNTKIQNIHF
jgi:hypothetical protein